MADRFVINREARAEVRAPQRMALLAADDDDLEGAGFGLRAMAGNGGQHLGSGQEDLLCGAVEAHGAGALDSFDSLLDLEVAGLLADDGESSRHRNWRRPGRDRSGRRR